MGGGGTVLKHPRKEETKLLKNSDFKAFRLNNFMADLIDYTFLNVMYCLIFNR